MLLQQTQRVNRSAKSRGTPLQLYFVAGPKHIRREPSPQPCLSHCPLRRCPCRYDVELFQRIEQLTDQQMEQYAAEQETVLLLLERVSEAQRFATMQVRGRGG